MRPFFAFESHFDMVITFSIIDLDLCIVSMTENENRGVWRYISEKRHFIIYLINNYVLVKAEMKNFKLCFQFELIVQLIQMM